MTEAIAEPSLNFEPGLLNDLADVEGNPFFSDDQKNHLPNLAKFKGEQGVAKIVKSMMELEKMHGADLDELKSKYLALLPEDATDEQKVEHKKKLASFIGVPENIDGYEVTFPEEIPEGLQIKDEHLKEAKELGLKHNLNPAALQDLIDLQMRIMMSQLDVFADNQVKVQGETDKKLKDYWKGDDYPKKLELIKRLLRGRVNPNAASIKEEDDESWQKFRKTVYASGVSNNEIVMKIIGDAAEHLLGTGRTIKGDGTTKSETEGALDYPEMKK